jgi:hypothetical protein
MSALIPHNNFTSVTIKNTSPTITSIAVNGQRQSKSLPAQYWQLSLEYGHLTREQFNEIMGFLSKQRGSLFQFNIIVPDLSRPSGSVRLVMEALNKKGGLTTHTNYFSGNNKIRLNADASFPTWTEFNTFYGAQASAQRAVGFRPGDFIRFANHSKVYQITENTAYSGVNFFSDVQFFPALQSDVPIGTAVTVYDVPFEVFNTNDTQEYSYGVGDRNKIILEVQEAL